MEIAGFDWDSGNWPKCGKHGVSREEIERLFLEGQARVVCLSRQTHPSDQRPLHAREGGKQL